MNHRTRALAFLAAVAAMHPVGARAEFCAQYQQTSSNAGACDNCTISVRKAPARQYTITGNNGWQASITRVSGQSGGTGEGRWLASGETFAFSMSETANGARITMRTSDQQVEASFRCTAR